MNKIEVQECRGLILELPDYNIISLPFYKFFNYGEGNASKINWNTARVFKKYDGSLLTMYYYNNVWNVATTGTIDANTSVNNNPDLMFSDLFWNTLNSVSGLSKDELTSKLDVKTTYMFELCTPYNIVVTPHAVSKVYLLGARDLRYLEELSNLELEKISKEINIPFAESYDLSSFEDILKTFDNMPFSEEGYIVCDNMRNRNKVKNPAYVAAHHLKSSTALYRIVDIIKSNEIDEYIATFPERREEILTLNDAFHLLAKTMMMGWEDLNISETLTRKMAAFLIIELTKTDKILKGLSGFYFSMLDKKIENAYSYLKNMDERSLYEKLLEIREV